MTESDTRFQFEVIKQLAESVRVNGEVMRDMQATQVVILERLARIEEQRVHEAVSALAVRVDALERTHDEQRGAMGAIGALRVWGPVVFSLFVAMYIIGRATGVIGSPPTTVTKIEAPLAVERRDPVQNHSEPHGAAP
ncbi:hypothetical protein [Novosphingobium sp. Leaf2]|uniref:hypothetical protein n=1 Tax=Novosphingobium sp. Leaf2 TaxID=1735670 RepID=UPI00070129E7|nr:hypothetical protein [Novosphingobium sp. Leaf2]KQM18374.1 hypothetical protein ASE49_09185 [Novosphingobium sp. Leaf2]